MNEQQRTWYICDPKKRTWYICDPKLNVDCEKTNCKYNKRSKNPVCDRTSRKEYALKDGQGNPIITIE